MKLSDIKNFVHDTASKAKFKLDKNAPDILLVGGIVLTVGGAVLACRSTYKNCDYIWEFAHKPKKGDREYCAESDKAIKKMFVKKCITGYALPIVMTAGGIVCEIKSNRMLHERLGVAIAYAALLKAQVDACNNEVDKAVQKEESKDESEAVFTKPVAEEIKHRIKGKTLSPYYFVFDRPNPNSDPKDRAGDLNFLRSVEATMNYRLNAEGHLFVNDCRKGCGEKESKSGAFAGWLKHRDPNDTTGDNYISFGLDNDYNTIYRAPDEPYIVDLNCDGIIINDPIFEEGDVEATTWNGGAIKRRCNWWAFTKEERKAIFGKDDDE